MGSYSFLQCVQEGIITNRKLHSHNAERTYFPDEVVVVVAFDDVVKRQCSSSSDSREIKAAICGLHAEQSLINTRVPANVLKKKTYQGMHTGAGFPRATPKEVLLRVQDVAYVLGM